MSIEERARSERLEAWLGAGLGSRPEADFFAGMDDSHASNLDSHLAGGVVLAANERAARSALGTIHARQVAGDRKAWITPAIFAWDGWVREQFLERNHTGLMLLNTLQEHALWRKIIRRSETGAALLHLDRLATTAQQAYRLLANYAPGALDPKARTGWSGDSLIFSGWLAEFDSICRREHLISSSRLAQHLEIILREEAAERRSRLLLIGFDRLLDSQVRLLDAWGTWQMDSANGSESVTKGLIQKPGSDKRFYQSADAASELSACLGWLQEKLAANPEARLLIVMPAFAARRGELERGLLSTSRREDAGTMPALDFEFSLGVPFGLAGVARSALLLLRWLVEPLAESEMDWLLTSDHCAASASEALRLAEAMRQVRRRGMERPEWLLNDFLMVAGGSSSRSARGAAGGPTGRFSSIVSAAESLVEPLAASALDSRSQFALPASWSDRLTSALDRMAVAPVSQAPLDWVSHAGDLLEILGWPGYRPESSLAFQARQRWQTTLEECGSLGFDGAEMSWSDFLSSVGHALSVTVFASESSAARIQITEPLESAGQLADGIWFLGAQEEAWPGRGVPHPLLPVGLQRDTEMPHASPAADWKLAEQATARLMRSADEIVFSCAEQVGELETRPSRLLRQVLGHPEKMPARFLEQAQSRSLEPLTECFEDASQIRYAKSKIDGGSSTLTDQSLCPFKAFGIARLDAGHWEAAEAGLNARQRGTLLHTVLDRVWAGADKGGISTSAELQQIADLPGFVGPIVEGVIRERASAERRDSFAARFPRRYLQLEAGRLTRLVSEWLAYEQTRLPFHVLSKEVGREVIIAGLRLDVRLDRVDELVGGSRLIIDYKSNDIGPAAWKGDRPDDVQLPLYATFAYDGGQKSGTSLEERGLQGLVFGRIKAGEREKLEFCGRVFDASAYLLPNLSRTNGLLRDPLTKTQLDEWHQVIERLGEDFLEGRADVDPKAGAKTCERCHLHAVCRIYENQPLAVELAGLEEDEPEAEMNVEGNP